MNNTQNTEIQPENVSRGEFLRSLGLGTSALMAFYCMGTLSSCSKASDPTPVTTGTGTTTNPTTGKIDFTMDLNTELQKVGDYTYNGSIIIIRTDTKVYVALSKACTHAGTTVEYRSSQKDIWCSNHGSVFNNDGTVKNGPAASSLRKYNTELSAMDTKLRVFE